MVGMVVLSLFMLGAPAKESIRFGHFGVVTLHRSSPHPAHVVILISGAGGWDSTMASTARTFDAVDALVIGVDFRSYERAVNRSAAKCAYPSGDFEPLSHYVEKKLGFPNYIRPVLAGYQAGATLAYAVLAQSPAGTFQGAISLGFSPDLSISVPFCKGSGLVSKSLPGRRGIEFGPETNLQEPWILLQGADDSVFGPLQARTFVEQVKSAQVVVLPGAGHALLPLKDRAPQVLDAFRRIVERPPAVKRAEAPEVRDLPLVEIPAAHPSNTLAVLLSGDGGWAGLDRSLGNNLAANGIPVVGLNSLQYFWHERTPDAASQDLARVLEHYLDSWNKQDAILAGYSFGADVLPFMASRLPPDLKQRIKLVALLGPSTWADFEFHLTDWIGGYDRKTSFPVIPEIGKLRGLNLLCVCGEGEEDSPCLNAEIDPARIVTLDGGHHFNGDYEALGRNILAAANAATNSTNINPRNSLPR